MVFLHLGMKASTIISEAEYREEEEEED